MSKIRYLIIIFLLIFSIKSVYAFDNSDKIYDYAQVLTENEEIKIKKEIDKYINKYNLDMVIVTVKHYTQGNLQDYINEFYNKNEFGIGINKDGIIIVLDLKNNVDNIDIKTYGLGNSLYSENEIKNILNEIDSQKEYNDKFLKFISYSNKYINKGENDNNNNNNNILANINWLGIIIISVIIPTIIITIGLLRNKNKKKEYKTNYYIKDNNIIINKKDDKFITTNTKKDRIKNKGFTLVELLAVITILAIISIIAVPIVLNLIEDLKIKSYDNSVENVMKAAKIYDLQSELTDEQALMDQNIYEEVKKNLSGNKPEDGTIYIKASNISETREIAFALQYGDWCYTKAYGEKTYTKTKTNECIVPMDYLMATHDNYPTTDIFLNNPFNITRESIERVITVPTNEVPEALKDNSWDVSVDKTGEIIAWYEKYQNENGEDRYTIYIGQEGGVKANSSSGFLFQNLINAEEIDLTYFDTSSVTYMGYMFAYCSSLTRLDVSKFDTSKVTSMTSMFRYCGKLISLDVGNFDTRDVTNISEMFYGCSSLNSLDVSNWNTENVTNMYAMFHRCSKVTTLDVSNWNTENVTDMSWMFSSCSNLTELYVSNFVTNRVTSMLSMFEGCSGLTELDVSNFVTDNVDNMYRMFGYCSSLTELDLSNFVTKKVTNMYGMFEECSSLTKLYLSNFDVSNVTNLSYMFKGCNSIEKIYVNKLWTFKEGADTTNIYGTGTTGESTVDWFEVVSTS